MFSKILIVEDEPLIALDIKRRLLRLGYEVVGIADSAETALQAVSQSSPHLVLMDIQLDGSVDGIHTAEQIHGRFNLPIVFVTAHADEVTLNQAKAIQPFGYIVKPFENHDLSTAIEIALSRHQAEQSMQQALLREKELHDLKSRFVTVVSHEFRNPLSVIQFALELLEQPDEALPFEKRQLYVRRAKDSVHHMRELLEDVLITGESEAGKLTYNPTPIDLSYFCRGLVDELQMDRATPPICLTMTSTLEPLKLYLFDSKLLRHILLNLLSNALKYSQDHGEISFDVMCEPTLVTFRIQDQGIGIPTADQAQIFSPFHRSLNAQKYPGTGLGLSIVKQCVDVHQGTIAIESQEGIGTTVTVTFRQ